jgi:mannose-6-phosphate isomerase
MQAALYPLTFEPIFKTVVWGGTALRPYFGAPSSSEATGEAWVLSDQGDQVSRIANGPLAGTTLRQVMEEHERDILGDAATSNGRFPLLLKFLDARENLSVQVHPNDEQARKLEPASTGLGKTEAWVILKADPGSRIYAGLREGVGRREFHDALKNGTLADVLHSYAPKAGDCVFLEAGTVHAIGAGLMLFEVQQTSDITYRLYDWGRVDAKTGQPRQLHIEQALECTSFERGPCNPVNARRIEPRGRDRVVECRYFTVDHALRSEPFEVGQMGECRIVVAIAGAGLLRHSGGHYPLRAGQAYLLPAALGACQAVPDGSIRVLECGIGSERTP